MIDLTKSNLHQIPTHPGYYANKDGKIYSVRELKPFIDKDGYLRVNTFVNKKRKRPGIHVLLALTFLKRKIKDSLVRHLDGNNQNNILSNLMWGTPEENNHDKAIHGSVKGSNNPRALLNEDQVRQIKLDLKQMKIREVALKFNISESAISAISCGQNWSHIKI